MKTLTDEVVEYTRQDKRDDVEHYQIGEKHYKIFVPRPAESTFNYFWLTAVLKGPSRCEAEEPWGAVDTGEHPYPKRDPLCPTKSAHLVGFHGVADGDVAFYREGDQAERGGVDAEVLKEYDDPTTCLAPEPSVSNHIVREDLIWYGGKEY